MKTFSLFCFMSACVLALVGCLDSEAALRNAEMVHDGAGFLATLGLPGASICSALTGVLAEFVRGRYEKKSVNAQFGAIARSVDAHLAELSPEDKILAKEKMQESLVKLVGPAKADKLKAALNTARDLSKAIKSHG